MKRLLCTLICFLVLSMCCVSQASTTAPYLKNCTIGIKTAKDYKNGNRVNVLNFTFEVSEKVDGGYLVAALYLNGKLDTVQMYDISQSACLPEKNQENSETPEYIEIIHSKTPDCIKIFIWDGFLKPVSHTENLLNAETIEKANENIVEYLTAAVEESEKAKNYTIAEAETNFIQTMIDFANDAKTLNKEYLLTREFAYRYYHDELIEMSDLYNLIKKKNLQNHFHDIFFDNDNVNIKRMDPIINYFELTKYMS